MKMIVRQKSHDWVKDRTRCRMDSLKLPSEPRRAKRARSSNSFTGTTNRGWRSLRLTRAVQRRQTHSRTAQRMTRPLSKTAKVQTRHQRLKSGQVKRMRLHCCSSKKRMCPHQVVVDRRQRMARKRSILPSPIRGKPRSSPSVRGRPSRR